MMAYFDCFQRNFYSCFFEELLFIYLFAFMYVDVSIPVNMGSLSVIFHSPPIPLSWGLTLWTVLATWETNKIQWSHCLCPPHRQGYRYVLDTQLDRWMVGSKLWFLWLPANALSCWTISAGPILPGYHL